jgi:DNA-binding transcriptional LysR family regulator
VVDLHLLSHAIALAKHGTYARAAEALHVSQPTLSRQIASLEAALGVRLFDRGRKGVSPTAFGRLLLHRASLLVLEAADFERDIELLQELKVGELRVGSGVYPAELSVGTAVGRLAARHPGLRVNVTTGDWRDAIAAVLSGDSDIAVVELSVLEGDKRLNIELLPPHDAVFYCRPGHPLLSERDLTLERIFDFPFAGPKLAPRVAAMLSRALRRPTVEEGTGDFLPSIKVDTVGLAKDAVAASNAFGVAPATAITDSVALGRLVPLALRPQWLHTGYGFAWLKNRSLSPAARAFIVEMTAVEAQLANSEKRLLKAISPSVPNEPPGEREVPTRAASGRRV